MTRFEPFFVPRQIGFVMRADGSQTRQLRFVSLDYGSQIRQINRILAKCGVRLCESILQLCFRRGLADYKKSQPLMFAGAARVSLSAHHFEKANFLSTVRRASAIAQFA
jgi:hypothetical protein